MFFFQLLALGEPFFLTVKNNPPAHGCHIPCVMRKWTLPADGLEHAVDPFLDLKVKDSAVICRGRTNLSMQLSSFLLFFKSLSDQDEG